MSNNLRILFATAFAVGVFGLATSAAAEDGVSADTVVFGQAVVFDGPAAAGAL